MRGGRRTRAAVEGAEIEVPALASGEGGSLIVLLLLLCGNGLGAGLVGTSGAFCVGD